MPVVDNELVPDRHQGPFIPLDLPLHQWIFDCLQRNLHTHGDGPWIVIKTFTYFLLFVFVYVCAIIFPNETRSFRECRICQQQIWLPADCSALEIYCLFDLSTWLHFMAMSAIDRSAIQIR